MKNTATLERLLDVIQENYPPETDTDDVVRAYHFADEAHKGQIRRTGHPYIVHPTAAAITLAEMRLELPVVIAALLHDVPEDTEITIEEIEKNFGEDIASMVAGVTKLGKVKYRGMERYVENLRKMFYAMATNVRTIFIKFADRLHNMSTLDVVPEPKRRRIAKEVMEIYAPIANRLGMGEFKGAFEDLSFRHLDPRGYNETRKLRDEKLRARRESLRITMEKLSAALDQQDLHPISIHGREKRLYSLHQKLARKEGDINRVYDLVAIRILMPKMADCYAALGIIHSMWKPLAGRIKDYIAQPKPNGYQSLHTTIFGEDGMIVELQIRTQEMHAHAEYGPAMHWRYKEGSQRNKELEQKWIKELVGIQQELKSKNEFLEHLEEIKLDAFNSRIFVFTPMGDVLDLPEGSTPIDFAYLIHTEVGNKCTGACINGDMVNLDAELRSGDMVQILTDKNRKGPNPDWLRFVKTRHARNKIRDATKNTMRGWIMQTFNKPGGKRSKDR